jgi:serine/threonine protein kinase/WD40 repeat protein
VAIKCPTCHSDNVNTARFCSNCATSLGASRDHELSQTKTLESPAHVVAPGIVIAGHYEVLEKLGQGGMGEVYRAVDKNLGRQAAIKILPEEFSTDPERLARFEREAKLLATLNHPNIAAVYGFEEANGLRFLAMELVEGDTLQRRLDRGALPMDEALETCRQVAEGLEAAHDKGIVHRDLKPGNIMITPEGNVKILDFGLAKAFTGETTGVDIANSPTITAQMTEPGVILGTAVYMSPEQARGRSVDKRADIWSFGCVLYECLTGTRAFHGETVSDTLAHILKGEPDWAALPRDTPFPIKALLHRCLQKDPRNRLHDVSDLRIEIVDALSYPLSEHTVAPTQPRRFRWIFVVGIAAMILAGAMGVIIGRKTIVMSVGPIVRTTIELPPGTQLTNVGPAIARTEIAFTPDGMSIVFSASPNGTSAKAMLYRRSLDSAESTPIRGTEGAMSPFISPDGKWVGFWAREKLFKIASSGGIPVELFDYKTFPPLGVCWSPEEKIITTRSVGTGLSEFSQKGDVRELTRPDPKKEYSHRLPFVLPGGKALLFTAMPFSWGVSAWIEVLNLKSGVRRVLIEDGADARYAPTGHIIFVRRGKLMAVPFDLDRLRLTGPPVPVVETLLQALNAGYNFLNSGSGQYCFSTSGALLYAPGGIFPNPENELFWVDRRGNVKSSTTFGKRPATTPRISPDGKRIAYATGGTDRNIWVYDIGRGTTTQVTSEGQALFPNWTPDGKHLAFSWSKAGPLSIWWKALDASAEAKLLAASEFNLFPGSWTRDGRFLPVAESNPKTRWNIFIFDIKEQKLQSFVATDAQEQWPDFAPDGRWLAYVSDKTGRNEVYVGSFSGGDKEFVVSNNGGSSPLWSPDGRELFYRDLEDKKLMKVDITTQPNFSVGPPLVIFEFVSGNANPIRGYDITPDGQEFLFSVRSQSGPKPVSVTQLNLVQNWFEELKRLVPASKK